MIAFVSALGLPLASVRSGIVASHRVQLSAGMEVWVEQAASLCAAVLRTSIHSIFIIHTYMELWSFTAVGLASYS